MAKLSSVKIAPAESLAAAPVPGRLVLGGFEKQKLDPGALPRALAAAAERAVAQGGWKGAEGDVVRERARGKASLLVEVHGLGRKGSFDARRLAKWLEDVVKQAGGEGESDLAIALPDHAAAGAGTERRLLMPLFLAGYRFQRFRKKSPARTPRRLRVVPPAGREAAWREALKAAGAVARGVALTRDLANTPPNEASPEWMAGEAGELARRRGMAIEVLDAAELEKRGMGGILAVGGGSAKPPRLVRLDWGDGDGGVSLVGKGVTFDTGGISIKPSAGMQDMKYDKSGACTVLGVASAAAELGLSGRFRAYLPLAENMPGGRAYRPGDIVRCYNGKTVEIHNTDAEGRMILADALAWAAEEKPGTLLEYSTLTGATVVALGHHAAALYTPDDGLANELLAASEASGERLWRMPLWPEYAKEMEGTHADLRNVSGRWGGANTAAAFLGNFVGRVRRWAHLDIAGIAYTSGESGKHGATGRGVAVSVEWLLRQREAAQG